MRIMVNGQPQDYPEPITVGGLLQALGIDSRTVVVERNLEILDRPVMDGQPIRDGDAIEIIRFVGGG
jgi:sulfur carrier protein